MKWTTEPPTEPGWWFVMPDLGNPCVKYYSDLDIESYVLAFENCKNAGWKWAGPIPEPEDA